MPVFIGERGGGGSIHKNEIMMCCTDHKSACIFCEFKEDLNCYWVIIQLIHAIAEFFSMIVRSSTLCVQKSYFVI